MRVRTLFFFFFLIFLSFCFFLSFNFLYSFLTLPIFSVGFPLFPPLLFLASFSLPLSFRFISYLLIPFSICVSYRVKCVISIMSDKWNTKKKSNYKQFRAKPWRCLQCGIWKKCGVPLNILSSVYSDTCRLYVTKCTNF